MRPPETRFTPGHCRPRRDGFEKRCYRSNTSTVVLAAAREHDQVQRPGRVTVDPCAGEFVNVKTVWVR